MKASDLNTFRSIFLDEAVGLIEGLEECLLAFESGDYSAERINAIFRVAHTLKGGAKAVRLEGLARFSHKMEDILVQVRQGKILPSREMATLLFKCLDVLKSYITGLSKDYDFTLDTSDLEKVLSETRMQSGEESPNAKDDDIIWPTDDEDSEEFNNSAAGEVKKDKDNEKQAESFLKFNQKAPDTLEKSGPHIQEEFLRVNLKKLDSLLNLVGELVVNQSVMTGHRSLGTTHSDHSLEIITYMEKLVGEIKDLSISLRMVDIKQLFLKMRRAFRDVAFELKKEVEFITVGEDVELDKAIHEKIGDVLAHLIRNAVDHGIEETDEREKNQKPRIAKVTLKAEQREDHILIIVSDDGRGMNPDKLVQTAIRTGLINERTSLTREEAFSLIFRPGFSTKQVVTNISGRGVGMDVVKKTVIELKGDISIRSEIGKGTDFVITLPLSLSIIPGMVVGIEKNKYVVPVSQLVETIEYHRLRIETSTHEGRMINLRGEVIPVISLSHLLHQKNGKDKKMNHSDNYQLGIVTLFNGRKVSFEIDEILGYQQIVLKKLGAEMRNLPGIIAGTILSDGEPGLILNLHELAERRKLHAAT